MKRIIIVSLLLISLAFNSFAQKKSSSDAQANSLSETITLPDGFVSDGCSKFPDGNYRDCCVAHDVKYFNGGSWKERWRADNELRKCVAAKSGFQNKPLSVMMWLGVRAFGVPWLKTSFRWGFGKDLVKK